MKNKKIEMTRSNYEKMHFFRDLLFPLIFIISMILNIILGSLQIRQKIKPLYVLAKDKIELGAVIYVKLQDMIKE